MASRGTCAVVATAVAGAGIATAGGRSSSHGRATCAGQSSAAFANVYHDADNLVVGPLALIGGRVYNSPETVRRIGGQKYPAIVAAGHTVKVAISPRARRTNALTYADAVHATRRLERPPRRDLPRVRRAAGREPRGRATGHVLVGLRARERAALPAPEGLDRRGEDAAAGEHADRPALLKRREA